MTAKALNVAGLNPEEMLEGGLKDDFRGAIIDAGYARWDYDGNIPDPVLAARLVIKDPEDEKPVVQHWSAGDLQSFVPSNDGEEPTDASDNEPGEYALRVGKKAQLNNNTNYAHLLSAILEAGRASKKFYSSNLTASIKCLIGLDAHWNRVPQKKRKGLVEEAAPGAPKARVREVLVVTEVFGYGSKKAASKAKAAPVEEEVEEVEADEVEEAAAPVANGLDTRIDDALVAVLAEVEGNVLKKSEIAKNILKAMAKDKDKGKAVTRSVEAAYLTGKDRPFTYDPKKGELSLG